MTKQRLKGLNDVHFLVQVLLLVPLFWIYVLVFASLHSHGVFSVRHYILYQVLLLGGLVLHRLSLGEKSINALDGHFGTCHQLALRQTLFGGMVLTGYLVATRDFTISRAFLFSFLPLLYLLLLCSYRWLMRPLATQIFNDKREQRTLLVGSHVQAAALEKWLKRKELLGLRALGLLCDGPLDQKSLFGMPVLGSVSDIEQVIREKFITHVIMLEFPYTPDASTPVVDVCCRYGVRLLVVDTLEERFQRPVNYFEDDGVRFMSLCSEPLESPWNRFLKRTMDLAVAIPAIFTVLPMACLFVKICQWIYSPGPLFHVQARAGLQNQRFRILKFRTMHQNHGEEGRQATLQDKRIYPAGKLLRKFSIDELPQFWNVLKGDMSVVGPRPHLIEHNERFAQVMREYHFRAFIKPGITGLAQIKGFRGETRTRQDLCNRVKWDIFYVENWSPNLDGAVIFQTFWHVLVPPRTAY